jgi:hypothetical protein
LLNGREIGQVEDLIVQPDGRHILRLITRCQTKAGRRVAIPIEWVRGIQDGRVVLLVGERELGLLPEYVPTVPNGAARPGVNAPLSTSNHAATVASRSDVLLAPG